MSAHAARSRGTVLVTGGAGYVGAVLVPRLLAEGWTVRVLDLFLFGADVLDEVADHPRLARIAGDIRDAVLLRDVLRGCDAVVHLACISNDPSFELDPELGRSINWDAFPLVEEALRAGVRRFVFASSSSVYGVSEAEDVDEDHPHRPLTDYSRYKSLCEPVLLERRSSSFAPVVVRPATVCGWSPRQRLDLTVNILTNHAVNLGRIRVFGGAQKRPNIHIEDLVDLYALLLELPAARVSGKVYNAGFQNHQVAEIAGIVRTVVEREVPGRERVEVATEPTDDHRSYHISSKRVREELGFAPRRSIEDAVRDLTAAFQEGRIPDPLDTDRYYNIKVIRARRDDLLAGAAPAAR